MNRRVFLFVAALILLVLVALSFFTPDAPSKPYDEAMQNFRATCPEIATSASRTEVRSFVLLVKVFLSGFIAPQYQSIQPPYDPKESMNIPITTERFIRQAHAKNIKVEP